MKWWLIYLSCVVLAEASSVVTKADSSSEESAKFTTAAIDKPGEWSHWSRWGSCTGDCTRASQSRTRQCTTAHLDGYKPCVGKNVERRHCTPGVHVEDCARCKYNTANIGYLMNCADPRKYYQCEKTRDNTYKLQLMSCAPCTEWDQDKLTCVRIQGCTDKALDNDYDDACDGSQGRFGIYKGDTTKFVVYTNPGQRTVMSCPSGTVFNLTQCTCVHGKSITYGYQDSLKCINFETMSAASSQWGFMDGGMWMGNHGKNDKSPHVQVSTNNCKVGRRCAFFGGQSYLSINSLANAFHTWQTFVISFWFKPSSSDYMGILTNGFEVNGCSSLPTIYVNSDGNEVQASVFTTTASARVRGKIRTGAWNHVSITRDEKRVTLVINYSQVDRKDLDGDLRPSHCPMILGTNERSVYFRGYLDNVCFQKGAKRRALIQFPIYLE